MIEFEVTFDNGDTHTIVADMRDVARWEMNGEGRSVSDLGDNPKLASLYELALYSLRRKGLFEGTLDDLLDAANVVPERNVDAPKATRKARTRTPS
jgi:hypothetical protein